MTSNTISAKLYAILDPLDAIEKDLTAACVLAERNKLPRPFLETIRGDIARLIAIWQNMNDIATTLDPDHSKHER